MACKNAKQGCSLTVHSLSGQPIRRPLSSEEVHQYRLEQLQKEGKGKEPERGPSEGEKGKLLGFGFDENSPSATLGPSLQELTLDVSPTSESAGFGSSSKSPGLNSRAAFEFVAPAPAAPAPAAPTAPTAAAAPAPAAPASLTAAAAAASPTAAAAPAAAAAASPAAAAPAAAAPPFSSLALTTPADTVRDSVASSSSALLDAPAPATITSSLRSLAVSRPRLRTPADLDVSGEWSEFQAQCGDDMESQLAFLQAEVVRLRAWKRNAEDWMGDVDRWMQAVGRKLENI